MLSRERVIEVIRHGRPDRMPIYGWVRANLNDPIVARFGSVEAFEDHYEFDFAHLFGGPPTYDGKVMEEARRATGGAIDPAALLDLPMVDPNDMARYEDVRRQVRHHKDERGRFVYMQTPGIFEALNGPYGIENHLLYLALCPEQVAATYRRQAEWNRQFAMNCIDLGVDMVHISDDWGAQRGLLFSPQTWWDLIYPNHKITVDAVKRRGTFVSLHSDGNVLPVLDGIVQLGFDVVHPWQESAGMSLELFASTYRSRFTVMGGLDVQTTIGFGQLDVLRREIERVMRMFATGGLLFCTTHFVQDHCSMDELVVAFDTVYDLTRRLGRG